MKWMALGTATIASLSGLASCSSNEVDAFFQEHFKELDENELQEVLGRLEEEYKIKKKIIVSRDPIPRKLDSGILVLPWKNFCEKLWNGDII